MRLAEHPDFEQAVLRAADHFHARGLRASIIEKDYYGTEALRIIASTYENQVIFKGGTSLSKGWNLIQRFSEDIDIFVDPGAFQPPLGNNGINRELKRLRDAVAAHPSLALLAEQSSTVGGFGRNDYFSYPQRFGGVGAMVNRVFVEAGTASGREPVVVLPIRSLLAHFMQETGASLVPKTKRHFPCGSCTFDEPLSRSCLLFTARFNCWCAMDSPWALTRVTITIYFSFPARMTCLRCSAPMNMPRSKQTMTGSARSILPNDTSHPP